jgi:hypothetical protein
VERAAQAELEDFIDAYVNAPMPGTIRQHHRDSSYGPRATSHESLVQSVEEPTSRSRPAASAKA